MINCLVYIKLMLLDIYIKILFWWKLKKNIKCLLMEYFFEIIVVYEGGIKCFWFSGICYSIVLIF